MAKLQLINGLPRMTIEAGATDPYDVSIEIVASGASGQYQLNGPISAGTNIALPDSQSYEVGKDELLINLNTQPMELLYDFAESSSTAFQLTFELEVGDRLDIRIDHS